MARSARFFRLVILAGAAVLFAFIGSQMLSVSRHKKGADPTISPLQPSAPQKTRIRPSDEAKWDFFSRTSDPMTKEAVACLRKGIAFYRALGRNPSGSGGWNTPGGYDLAYSLDLTERIGRQDSKNTSPTSATSIEPGTPTIGKAFLIAFEKTGNPEFLEAAEEVGDALIVAQLKSGGWTEIEFDQERKAAKDRYQECLAASKAHEQGRKVKYNPNLDNPARMMRAGLKERVTQVALDFMIDLEQATGQPRFRECAARGIQFLIDAQFPSGAWPMTWPLEERKDHLPDEIVPNTFSFNDGGTASCVQTMLKAWRACRDPKFLDSAVRGADFILRSQNPEGGWCLHYTYDMRPTWGRGNPHRKSGGIGQAVEPPSNHSQMTAEVVKTLLILFLETGDTRYFESAKRGADWLVSVKMAGDYWAEFYEFGTNKPLFQKVTPKQRIFINDPAERSYDDGYYHFPPDATIPLCLCDQETFPATVIYKDVARTLALFDHVRRNGREEILRQMDTPPLDVMSERANELQPVVRELIEKQGNDGRWCDNVHNEKYTYYYDRPNVYETVDGKKVETRISSANFETNVRILSEWLALGMRLSYLTRERAQGNAAN